MAVTVSVPERLVCCSVCDMWIEFEKSGITCNFVAVSENDFVFQCSKCRRLEELENLLKDCSCKEQWSVVEGAVGHGPTKVSPVPVTLTNRFEVLSGDDESVVEVVEETPEVARDSKVERKDMWSGDKSKGKVVLCGDSLVRYVDREFCRVDRVNRTRICLPGAKIQDISNRVNAIVADEEVVVVQVGTNNLQKESLEVIRSRYKELLCRLYSTRAKVIICGLLPRFDGKVASHRIVSVNECLQNLCFDYSFKFVDMWSGFQGRKDLFARDGLHLSNAGSALFGRVVNYSIDQVNLN